jgi:hypothetical protein
VARRRVTRVIRSATKHIWTVLTSSPMGGAGLTPLRVSGEPVKARAVSEAVILHGAARLPQVLVNFARSSIPGA